MELSGEDSGRGVFFFFHGSKLSQHGMKRALTTKFSIDVYVYVPFALHREGHYLGDCDILLDVLLWAKYRCGVPTTII